MRLRVTVMWALAVGAAAALACLLVGDPPPLAALMVGLGTALAYLLGAGLEEAALRWRRSHPAPPLPGRRVIAFTLGAAALGTGGAFAAFQMGGAVGAAIGGAVGLLAPFLLDLAVRSNDEQHEQHEQSS